MSVNRRDKVRLPPFVPLLKATMKTDAWRATSHGARSLYAALKSRYNTRLGNAVFLSTRVAAAEIGSHKDQVVRWYRELAHYGFIVMTSPGSLGVEGRGKAPHWRLTEENYIGRAPTREFLQWDGTKFEHPKKQNPVPETRDTASRKLGTVLSRKPGTVTPQGVPETRDIQPPPPVLETRDITSLTTPLLQTNDACAVAQRLYPEQQTCRRAAATSAKCQRQAFVGDLATPSRWLPAR